MAAARLTGGSPILSLAYLRSRKPFWRRLPAAGTSLLPEHPPEMPRGISAPVCSKLYSAGPSLHSGTNASWLRRRREGISGFAFIWTLRSLWDWPWELLCDPARGFLAATPGTPVVRYVEMADIIPPLRARPPLRVLVVAASPSGLSPIGVEEELEDLEQSLTELPLGRLAGSRGSAECGPRGSSPEAG